MSVKCSVKKDWFTRKDANGHQIREWAVEKTDVNVYCKLCECVITVERKGFQALEQHASTLIHQNSIKVKLNPLQQVLFKTPLQNTLKESNNNNNTIVLELGTKKTQALKSELIWAMKCVASGYSASSCDGVVDTFKAMFGEENVSQEMSLGRTKISYLWTDALRPFFMMKWCEMLS